MKRACALTCGICLAACHREVPKPPARESVEEAEKRILTTKDFVFCQPSDQAMPPWERDWCDIADRATVCPQIKEMCDRKWDGSWISQSEDDGSGKAPARTPSGGKLNEWDWGGAFDKLHLPQLKGLGFVLWVVVGLLLAGLIAVIVRAVIDRKRTTETAPETDESDTPVMALDLADPGLGDVALLLAGARAEADRDVAKAFAMLYAAVLRHLEDKGFIRWDSATTNRQYIREVRGKTPLDRPMSELVREVERTKFGHDQPQRTIFDRLHSSIVSLVSGTAALVLVTLLSGCGGCGDPSLNGHAAFNDLIRSQGIEPARLSVPIDKVTGDDPPILIDAEYLGIDAAMLHAITRAMLTGARILLLADSRQGFPAWPSLEFKPTKGKAIVPRAAWAKEMKLPPDLSGALPSAVVFKLDAAERDPPEVLLEHDGTPFAIRWRSDAGELLVVADRELFANASMAVPANAELAMALVRDLVGDRKELATAALGPTSGAESPGESLGQAGLLPLMLQALLALGLLFWARGAAFGTLRDRSVQARRTFAEHVSAIGLQFAQSRGSRFAAGLYASYAIERLWGRVGRQGDRHDSAALAASIAARTGQPEDDVRQLLEAAEAARREPNGVPTPQRDLELIRNLHGLVAAMRAD